MNSYEIIIAMLSAHIRRSTFSLVCAWYDVIKIRNNVVILRWNISRKPRTQAAHFLRASFNDDLTVSCFWQSQQSRMAMTRSSKFLCRLFLGTASAAVSRFDEVVNFFLIFLRSIDHKVIFCFSWSSSGQVSNVICSSVGLPTCMNFSSNLEKFARNPRQFVAIEMLWVDRLAT